LSADIEGSRLWQQHPEMRDALVGHDAALHSAIEEHDGHLAGARPRQTHAQ
jgi:hypothetical protein